MTERERLLAVYRGEVPDRVPFILDLSHWFSHKHRLPFDLSGSLTEDLEPLVAYHRQAGAGFYLPSFPVFRTVYPDDVRSTVAKCEGPAGLEIVWRLETPLGAIERRRLWRDESYSWNISKWGVETPRDLRVLADALGRARFCPISALFEIGDIGVPYAGLGYSAMGHLLNYWMGVENTLYAVADLPDLLEEVVTGINENLLGAVDVVCRSPAEIVLMGDNFSSDVQPPHFFRRWSAPYYREAFRRLHAAGKFVAVHVDGKLRGLLGELAALGADAVDAVTPAPMGDLTPLACREEAGPRLILSGGVPPTVWMPEATDADFHRAVIDWLELRRHSPRLLAAAGDQVPPGAPEHRIAMMRDLVEEHGRY